MRPKIRIKDTIDRLASHSGLFHVGTLLEATDLKQRLPSGHFASNSLVLHLAMLSYNILRIIGQYSLEEARGKGINLPGSRSTKHVQRRRIRTVTQDLMYMAGRLVYRGRQWHIGFGRLNPFARLWGLIDCRLPAWRKRLGVLHGVPEKHFPTG